MGVGAASSRPPIRRGYVDVPWGQLHYARCGEGIGPAVVLLHQTPRSWDEYRDVLPLLGSEFDTLAPDTAGFGASDLGHREDSIEHYAEALALLLHGLGLEEVSLVGHHTGALVALEAAVRFRPLVRSVVLSSAPLRTAIERVAALAGPGIDDVEPQPDGDHLAELWRRRQPFYPEGRPDLLHRFVTDALRVATRVGEGHRAVNRYDAPRRAEELRRTGVAVLILAGIEDPFVHPMLPRWRAVLPDAEVVEIPAGMVPLPDQIPEAFAAAVADFLHAVHRGDR